MTCKVYFQFMLLWTVCSFSRPTYLVWLHTNIVYTNAVVLRTPPLRWWCDSLAKMCYLLRTKYTIGVFSLCANDTIAQLTSIAAIFHETILRHHICNHSPYAFAYALCRPAPNGSATIRFRRTIKGKHFGLMNSLYNALYLSVLLWCGMAVDGCWYVNRSIY